MTTTTVLTRHERLTRHLTNITQSAALRDEFRGLDGVLLDALVSTSMSRAESFSDALRNAYAHIAVAKSIASGMRGWRGTTTRWQDVLAALIEDNAYLESFDALTVDGNVITDLLVALNARS